MALTIEHFPMRQIVVKDSGQVAEQRSSARWLEENTNWHAMVGKHVQSVSSELFTPEQRSPTALLGFTLEVVEMVFFWYMRHSSVEGGNNDEVPPLMICCGKKKVQRPWPSNFTAAFSQGST